MHINNAILKSIGMFQLMSSKCYAYANPQYLVGRGMCQTFIHAKRFACKRLEFSPTHENLYMYICASKAANELFIK